MSCRPISWTVSALLLLLLASGCRRPQLVSRPMTATEVGWADTIQRSYPGWRPPFYLPDRVGWQPRPRVEEELPRFSSAPDSSAVGVPVAGASTVTLPAVVDPSGTASPEPIAPTSGERETVVDVAIPAASVGGAEAPKTVRPPVRVGTGQLTSPVSREASPEPAKPAAPPSLDDVEFVPADAP